jgi:SET domain-containing protein
MAETAPRGARSDVAVRASAIQGQGVFAARSFQPGEVILEIDDSEPVLDRSALTREQEIFIDVFVGTDGSTRTTWMKTPEKRINHSCDPNSFVQTDPVSGVRRTLARREIRAGDELTWDYALNIWEEWVAPVPCACGSSSCRRIIQGNFFTLPLEIQRGYLPLLDGPFKQRFAERLRSIDSQGDARAR